MLDQVLSIRQVSNKVSNQQSAPAELATDLGNISNIPGGVSNIPGSASNKKGAPKCSKYVANAELMRVGGNEPSQKLTSSLDPGSIVVILNLLHSQ